MRLIPAFFLIFMCFSSLSYGAGEIISIEDRVKILEKRFLDLKKSLGLAFIHRIENAKRRTTLAHKRSDIRRKKEYLKLKNEYVFWLKARHLSDLLRGQYQKFNSSRRRAVSYDLITETDELALTLMKKIGHLKEVYGINNFPVIHNLYIDLGIKKRGSCWHWATDLLAEVNKKDHPHFVTMWGKVHPGNILEHNVAVLVPKNAPFKEGIVIDPWRTAGKPFWIVVKDDYHNWKQWDAYEPQ